MEDFACSVFWLEPVIHTQASLASVRVSEGNGVSVKVRLKINDLPTTAAVAVISARSALHGLYRQRLWTALKPSVESN